MVLFLKGEEMRVPTFDLIDRLFSCAIAGECLHCLPNMSREIYHEVEQDMRRERRRWMRCQEYGMVWVTEGKRREKAA